jgi:hypothetical protein
MIKLMKQRWWCKSKTTLIFKHRDSRIEFQIPIRKNDDPNYFNVSCEQKIYLSKDAVARIALYMEYINNLEVIKKAFEKNLSL